MLTELSCGRNSPVGSLMRIDVALARGTYSGSDLTLDVVARLPLPRTTLFTSASTLLSRILCGVLRGW